MFLTKLLQKEYGHFQQLRPLAQRFLLSLMSFEFVYPLFFVFINAFILRRTENFTAVALYNLANFIVLPIAFVLNGYLLKKVPIKYLYLFGLVGQGLVVSSLFFFPFTTSLSLFLFGCLQGIPAGIYWGNRNFISLSATQDEYRSFYIGLEMIIGTTMSVITPVLLGWILIFGEQSSLYTIDFAYRALSICMLFILVGSGLILFSEKEVKNPELKSVLVKNPSPRWKLARLMESFRGVGDGIKMFIDTLIIFTFLGKEGAIGTIQSISAIIAVFAIYFFSSRIGVHRRTMMVTTITCCLLVVATVFTFFFSPIAAVIYLPSYRLLDRLQWIFLSPISLKVIDDEEGGDPTNNYAYIANRELFLNIGRIIGLGIFFSLIALFSQIHALRFIPLITAAFQVGVVILGRRLAKKV